MDSREQFEAWIKECGFSAAKHPANNDLYDDYTVDSMWDAWQASREAVVVVLPGAHKAYSGDRHPAMFADEVRTAIEAAGVKVAP